LIEGSQAIHVSLACPAKYVYLDPCTLE
jgi:hypothetical protein